MVKSYKLNKEIKEFIIEKKKTNPELSCRGLIPLIREHFHVSLSKSLINSVIKQNNLSSPAGRKRSREEFIFMGPVEIKPMRKERAFIEQGGSIFLKIADFKLGLTAILANGLSAYFPVLAEQDFRGLIEASIYSTLFKDKKSLWLFIGKEIPLEIIKQYSQKLARIPVSEVNNALMRIDFRDKLNSANELHQQCLSQLNIYAQANFFPEAYQFLDFSAMQERFYALWAKIKRTDNALEVQFLCPEGFSWMGDMVWQEDLSYAAEKINSLRVFTPEKELILVNSKLEILPKVTT